jgi:ABC-type proline/glycine betaine transport system permease subunit
MRAIRNQMTIAHLSMSLIAYAAAILLDQPEKIRCFRTFAVQEPRLALAS